MYYVYVIRCEDGSLYTGYTTDVLRRLGEHSGGKKGAKYTKSHKPGELCTVWECESRSAAMSLECFFKKFKKNKKEAVIRKPQEIFDGDGEKFIGKIADCSEKYKKILKKY